MKGVVNHFELTESHLLAIMTDNGSSNDSMTRELQSTLEASRIGWPAMKNHIPCIAHLIQLALRSLMTGLRVKVRTKSRDTHERDQHFGENRGTAMWKRRRLWKEGSSGLNKVSARRPRLAKIIEKVCISRHFEYPETECPIEENTCCIDYTDTEASKPVHRLSKSQITNPSTTYSRYVNTKGFDTGVVWASQMHMRIHPWVAQKSKIQWIPVTLHITGWMD